MLCANMVNSKYYSKCGTDFYGKMSLQIWDGGSISFIIECELKWVGGIWGPLPKMVKSEMWQILWDGQKMKKCDNIKGQREYIPRSKFWDKTKFLKNCDIRGQNPYFNSHFFKLNSTKQITIDE